MKEHMLKKNEYFESSQIIQNDLKTYLKEHCQVRTTILNINFMPMIFITFI